MQLSPIGGNWHLRILVRLAFRTQIAVLPTGFTAISSRSAVERFALSGAGIAGHRSRQQNARPARAAAGLRIGEKNPAGPLSADAPGH